VSETWKNRWDIWTLPVDAEGKPRGTWLMEAIVHTDNPETARVEALRHWRPGKRVEIRNLIEGSIAIVPKEVAL